MTNEQSSKYYEAGIDDVIEKPLEKEALLTKLFIAMMDGKG